MNETKTLKEKLHKITLAIINFCFWATVMLNAIIIVIYFYTKTQADLTLILLVLLTLMPIYIHTVKEELSE